MDPMEPIGGISLEDYAMYAEYGITGAEWSQI